MARWLCASTVMMLSAFAKPTRVATPALSAAARMKAGPRIGGQIFTESVGPVFVLRSLGHCGRAALWALEFNVGYDHVGLD